MRIRARVLKHAMAAIGLVIVLVAAGGCEVFSKAPPEKVGEQPEIAWPDFPLQPRIRFLRAVAKPEDLGISPSFWKRAAEFLFGKKEERLVRPSGVSRAGGVIFVADPGAQAMWIIDTKGKRFQSIRQAGEEPLVSPVSVTAGGVDRIYLADSYLAKVFIFSPDGKLKGTIEHKNVRRPVGLTYDGPRDRLYVSDSQAHRIWIFSGDGKLTGEIGRRGSGDGEFNFPTHVTVDREGLLYVTDSLGFRVQIFSAAGKFITQFGRHGDTSGDFASPKGVGVDSEGHIYVVEALFDAVQIFDRKGRYLMTFGDQGESPGQFWLPTGIFISQKNRIFVADSYNQRIQIFEYLEEGKR